MTSLTIRIDSVSHQLLKQMSEQLGESMQGVLAQAIELYHHESFLQKCNEAYLKLKKDTKAWKDELNDRDEWDSTLSDNIE